MSNRLGHDQQLSIGEALVASNGLTRLVMQGDGNLVLYRIDSGRALWASNTAGKPVVRVLMQADGNLVCYDAGGKPYWSSGTYRAPGSNLVLQDDGNLVIRNPTGAAAWATSTPQDWATAKYHFRVRTADEMGAGTDSNIFLILYGELGQTREVRLNGYIHGNAFERNRTDTFDIPLEAVGRIYKIRVRSDTAYPASAWRLARIEVIPLEPPQPQSVFPYDDWISDKAPREITATDWTITYEGAVHSTVVARSIAAFDLLDTDQSVQQEFTVSYTLSDQVQLSSEVHDLAKLETETKWESPSKVLNVDVAKLTADVKATWQHEIDSKRIDTNTWQLVVSDKKTVTFPARRLTLVMVEWTEPYTAMLARLGSVSVGLRRLDALPSPAGWTLKSLSVGDEIGEPFASWLQANRPDLLAKLRRPLPPAFCHYLTRTGDNWDSIAGRLLGDAKLAGQIKLANPAIGAPRPGQRLAVPWPAGELQYLVKRGDGYYAVARGTYGTATPELVTTIQEWNGGPNHVLKTGETIYCPA